MEKNNPLLEDLMNILKKLGYVYVRKDNLPIVIEYLFSHGHNSITIDLTSDNQSEYTWLMVKVNF
jgi:hypothetical protein